MHTRPIPTNATILQISCSTFNYVAKVSYEHYVNSIPFINADTGEKTILMPVFPSKQTDLDRKLIAQNTKTLNEIGYKVDYVPTTANELKGGIHCLVNVLE